MRRRRRRRHDPAATRPPRHLYNLDVDRCELKCRGLIWVRERRVATTRAGERGLESGLAGCQSELETLDIVWGTRQHSLKHQTPHGGVRSLLAACARGLQLLHAFHLATHTADRGFGYTAGAQRLQARRGLSQLRWAASLLAAASPDDGFELL